LLVLARSNNGTFVNNIKVGSDPVELRHKVGSLVLAMVLASGCQGGMQGYGRACRQNWHGALLQDMVRIAEIEMQYIDERVPCTRHCMPVCVVRDGRFTTQHPSSACRARSLSTKS
jgi:hypothetical protein